LTFAAADPSWAMFALYCLMVLVGVNMIIIVHELGHFVVARLCGVKCEKFYIWFDFFGLRFCRFKWGETEYGLGVFPLGGYVKMLGQEDNPARLRQELERAKAARAAGESSDKSAPRGNPNQAESSQAPEIDIEAAERALYDPRSYLAQSVPKRMAIISAGVIMNVVFAFVLAVIAYWLGVRQTACVVGTVFPGEAAWCADLKVGDRIVEVAGVPARRFRDLNREISVGDIDDGVPLVILRRGKDGRDKRLELTLEPDRIRVAPTIGIGSCSIPTLSERSPLVPGSPAALALPTFRAGDRIVRINDQPITDYAGIHSQLALHPEETLRVTVLREPVKSLSESPSPPTPLPASGARGGRSGIGTLPASGARGARSGIGTLPASGARGGHSGIGIKAEGPPAAAKEITVEVAPAPMRRLGLVMQMGPITAIQKNSPAALEAEPAFRLGDRIVSVVDDHGFQWDGDPMTLPDQLRRLADRTETGHLITVRVSREGEGRSEPIEVSVNVPLRRADWYSTPLTPSSPMTIPALGVAYDVLSRIQEVRKGSPADQAGLKGGEVVVQATLTAPKEETLKTEQLGTAGKFKQPDLILSFRQGESEKKHSRNANWPCLIYTLQELLPGTMVTLELEDGRTVDLKPVDSADWFNPDRGFGFEPLAFTQTAGSVYEAIVLGIRETADALTLISRTVKSLGTGQVSFNALVGPVGIVEWAYQSAKEGPGDLLAFLCLISANLAVINILPIPVLDGGHIVFLTYEAIRGKPPSEGVVVALSYLGLALILLLTIWVFGLDIGCIPRE